MAVYAGESVQVAMSGVDFNGTALEPTNVVSAKITISDPTGVVLVDDQFMNWSSPESLWIYQWETGAVDAGAYKAKCVINGFGSTVSWEYKTIRLRRNPTI